jgi:hypothetical protein
MNKQENNVGNLGDVIKHVSYCALLLKLGKCWQGEILSVDTHGFRVCSKISENAYNENSVLWWSNLAEMKKVFSNEEIEEVEAYSHYRSLQPKAHVNNENYLCSPGIAMLTLPAEKTQFFWGEKNPKDKTTLLSQGRELSSSLGINPGNIVVKGKASEVLECVLNRIKSEPVCSAAILVDPFNLKSWEEEDREDSLQKLKEIFDNIQGPSFALCFDYGKKNNWADPKKIGGSSSNLLSLLSNLKQYLKATKKCKAKNKGKFYHLAVYVNDAGKSIVQDALRGLGWEFRN